MNKTVKKISIWALTSLVWVIGYFFVNFVIDQFKGPSTYEKGYTHGWGLKDEPFFWASKEEKEGYAKGLDDQSNYIDGETAGMCFSEPKSDKNPFYLKGFKEGRKFSQKLKE